MSGFVRIASGRFKGMKIATPGVGTHPMGERERIALFNMLYGMAPGARVLDAYAGSGAIGIEALGRGAGEVVFVEKNPRAAATIKENLVSVVKMADRARVMRGSVAQFVERAVTEKQEFDLVIADPPYDAFNLDEVKQLERILKEGGYLILSHPGEAEELPGLQLLEHKRYAGARLAIYRK